MAEPRRVFLSVAVGGPAENQYRLDIDCQLVLLLGTAAFFNFFGKVSVHHCCRRHFGNPADQLILELYINKKDEIELVLTDLGMPGMGARSSSKSTVPSTLW